MFSSLFSPINIGTLALKNRLVVAPMDTAYGIPNNHGRVTDFHVAHFKEKTRGGWGFVIIEANAVIDRNNNLSRDIELCSDDQIEGHQRLVNIAHTNGSKICVQLVHSGRQSSYIGHGAYPPAPSPIADPLMGYTPSEITTYQIHYLIEAFGHAAVRAKMAGYDAVEIHGAHGYLINEFMSPYANKRTDEYGGTLEGRAKFALDIIRSIKEKCGSDYPVLFRMSIDDYLPHGEGVKLPDSLALAMLFEEGGVDAIHATVGNYTTIQYMIPPAAVERGFSSHLAAELKKVLSIPVIHVGRYNDPYIAEAAIRSGRCDLVSMGRQSLADPDFPIKAACGDIDDIRRCIGCQVGCVENLWTGTPIQCTVNPRIGHELEYPEPTKRSPISKRVVIVGGGVGGMEAAISAAECGHFVTLYEKSDRLGGQFNIACVPPYKQELSTLVTWQKRQLEKLGVSVVLNHEVTAEQLLDEQPDAVVLCTGAQPVKPPFKGADLPHVFTQTEILSGEKMVGGHVAVIGGGDVGCETAAFIASTGKQASIFEMTDVVCPKMETSVKYFLQKYLEEKNVHIHLRAKVLELQEGCILYEQDGVQKAYGPISNIVIAIGSKPYNPLEQLLEGKLPIYVVGDASGVRRGIDAVQEGYHIGKVL